MKRIMQYCLHVLMRVYPLVCRQNYFKSCQQISANFQNRLMLARTKLLHELQSHTDRTSVCQFLLFCSLQPNISLVCVCGYRHKTSASRGVPVYCTYHGGMARLGWPGWTLDTHVCILGSEVYDKHWCVKPEMFQKLVTAVERLISAPINSKTSVIPS